MKENLRKHYGLNSQEERLSTTIPVSNEESREGLVLGTHGGVEYVKGEECEKRLISTN